MHDHEARIYSQNGEDGVIAHILSRIGVTNRVAVEFGVGDGTENNTRLLAHLGWRTYWFDLASVQHIPPGCRFVQVKLTADNIDQMFKQQGIPTKFDVLSTDVDGNDWYLRQALHRFRPRLIVMEYNGARPAAERYVMPRDDDYAWSLWQTDFGASLLSLTEQAQDLGYDLVHCESRGVNAFYVRRDVNVLPALTVEQAWRPLWWASQIS